MPTGAPSINTSASPGLPLGMRHAVICDACIKAKRSVKKCKELGHHVFGELSEAGTDATVAGLSARNLFCSQTAASSASQGRGRPIHAQSLGHAGSSRSRSLCFGTWAVVPPECTSAEYNQSDIQWKGLSLCEDEPGGMGGSCTSEVFVKMTR